MLAEGCDSVNPNMQNMLFGEVGDCHACEEAVIHVKHAVTGFVLRVSAQREAPPRTFEVVPLVKDVMVGCEGKGWCRCESCSGELT